MECGIVFMGPSGIRIPGAEWLPCGSPIQLLAMHSGMGAWAVIARSPSRGVRGWLQGGGRSICTFLLFVCGAVFTVGPVVGLWEHV